MPHPGRNKIYEAAIKRMVREAMDLQEREFVQNRGSDSDEQLLAYLRICAKTLGHTPWPREVTGGSLIKIRFATWDNALRKANLPKPTQPDRLTAFVRYREEVQRQQVIYREKKAEKKQRAQQRLETQKQRQGHAPAAVEK